MLSIDPVAQATGLLLPRQGRHVWRYDDRPVAIIDRRVQVGRSVELTYDTEEAAVGDTRRGLPLNAECRLPAA
ncbi:MAG: hypothetical protein OJF49_004239 [Ktedonobacterales bacterium]|jgi:hypothetical protein|nr:MAG: hypothetical protein OJF49_004239 [Ktedonobacterales bacterium]